MVDFYTCGINVFGIHMPCCCLNRRPQEHGIRVLPFTERQPKKEYLHVRTGVSPMANKSELVSER